VAWPRAACGGAVAPFRRGRRGDRGGAQDGAAYLPIDPALPQARIAFMLTDAAPFAAITTADLADRLGGFDGPSSISVIPLTLPQTPNPISGWGPCPRRRRLRDLHLRHDRTPRA